MIMSYNTCPKTSAVLLCCSICGDRADGYHFGAICCAACGAFFRRSISDQKVYSCFTRNCNVQFEALKRGGTCRFCRFLKCLQSGMLPQEVRAKRSSISENRSSPGMMRQIVAGSHLEVLIHLRREIASSKQASHDYGSSATFTSFKHVLQTEFQVFKRLITLYSTIFNLLSDEALVMVDNTTWHQLEKTCHTRDLFIMFFIHESCLATAVNGGVQLDRLILPNMSYIDLSETFLKSFYGIDESARDPACLARLSLSAFNFIVQTVSKSLQATRLDEPEAALLFFCAMFQLVPVIRRTNPAQFVFSAIINEIYNTLSASGCDGSTRMGNILLLLSPLIQAFDSFKQLITMLELSEIRWN